MRLILFCVKKLKKDTLKIKSLGCIFNSIVFRLQLILEFNATRVQQVWPLFRKEKEELQLLLE